MEKMRAKQLMKQLPLSGKTITNSKLLPHASLADMFTFGKLK